MHISKIPTYNNNNFQIIPTYMRCGAKMSTYIIIFFKIKYCHINYHWYIIEITRTNFLSLLYSKELKHVKIFHKNDNSREHCMFISPADGWKWRSKSLFFRDPLNPLGYLCERKGGNRVLSLLYLFNFYFAHACM